MAGIPLHHLTNGTVWLTIVERVLQTVAATRCGKVQFKLSIDDKARPELPLSWMDAVVPEESHPFKQEPVHVEHRLCAAAGRLRPAARLSRALSS